MSDTTLKPCPYCGHAAITDSYTGDLTEYARCGNTLCGCAGVVELEAWQRRPVEDALRQRIAELEADQRWVPVEERMPMGTEDVLGYADFSGTLAIVYRRAGVWVTIDDEKIRITHWMELPALPTLPEVKE